MGPASITGVRTVNWKRTPHVPAGFKSLPPLMDKDVIEAIRQGSYEMLRKTGNFTPEMVAKIDREINGMSDPDVVRHNCADCGRERVQGDDNHTPGCFFEFRHLDLPE